MANSRLWRIPVGVGVAIGIGVVENPWEFDTDPDTDSDPDYRKRSYCELLCQRQQFSFWPARSTRMPLRAHYERVFRTFAPFVVTP
jgi:hypothetical protein